MSRAQFAPLSSADVERDERAEVQQPVRRTATPLVVGAADDRAEVEADRVADAVIARLQGGESAEAGGTHAHDGCHGVARSAAPAPAGAEVGFEGGAISDETSARIEARRGTGSALDGEVRQRMESGFGRSLGDVRIHTDSEAADLNRSVSARAFTTGKDIFFGQGEYQPGTAQGEQVLAHELAHTQQGGGGVGRIHRLWDFKKSKLGLERATDISTLDSRPIWILEDATEDRMVVKTEDQPLGLGLLAAKLQKKSAGIKSVKQRELSKNDRLAIDNMIEVRSMSGSLNESWEKRGRTLLSGVDGAESEDPTETAKHDAIENLWAKGKKVIAMSFAEGTGADKLAQPEADKPDDDDLSGMRRLMLDPQHLRLLGQMTAVDAFFGNQDRLMNGNLGNWFVSPTGGVELIDSIDPGGPIRYSAADAFGDFTHWSSDDLMAGKYAAGPLFADDTRGALMADQLLSGAQLAGFHRDTGGGDATAVAWGQRQVDGENYSRKDFMAAYLDDGFKSGARRIAKIFATTKWSLRSLRDHSAKKSIRSAAKKASRMDGGQTDYYQVLKQRADWIRATSACS